MVLCYSTKHASRIYDLPYCYYNGLMKDLLRPGQLSPFELQSALRYLIVLVLTLTVQRLHGHENILSLSIAQPWLLSFVVGVESSESRVKLRVWLSNLPIFVLGFVIIETVLFYLHRRSWSHLVAVSQCTALLLKDQIRDQSKILSAKFFVGK